MIEANEVDLPLRLRSDRGYIFFPDAIESSLQLFAKRPWRNLKAECFKISDRKIIVEETNAERFDSRESGVFGRMLWLEEGQERFLVMRESVQANLSRYEMHEPEFEFEFIDSPELGRQMRPRIPGNFYPSIFHRWALCAKKLYHLADSEGRRRMLLQRLVTSKDCSFTPGMEETFKLDFMTKDRFFKISIWQNGRLAGEIIANAQPVD